MVWMNSSLKAYDWILLGMEAQNCFLNESKPNTWAHWRCMKTWATSKAKNSQDACLPSVRPSHFKQIPKDHNQCSSLLSASPSHFIIIKVQACQVSSILNGSRKSKWPNFALRHIWFATSLLSLKFVSLFHISIFLWILKIYVAFDVLCSCIYFKKFHTQK